MTGTTALTDLVTATAAPPHADRSALAAIDRDRLVTATADLIRGRGENPGGTEAETVRRLQTLCEGIGATVTVQEWAPGRANLHATLGPAGGPAILFLGHSDVVPAGHGWSADPFEPRIDEQWIIGRGATDMKGGLAAIVAAMDAAHGADPALRLDLLCTADEEDRALGVAAWLGDAAPQRYVGCVVAEPTDLEVVIGCRGASNFVIDVIGASAHAGRPEDGASSISAAARVVEFVGEQHRAARAGAQDALLGSPTWNVGTVAGGTGTSMVPRATTLSIDRRMMPGEDADRILADLLEGARAAVAAAPFANADAITLTGRVDMRMPGFRTDASDPLPSSAVAALAALGRPAPITGWTAACEGGFVAEFYDAPTIILGPGSITAEAHQPDEKLAIEQLVAAAEAYTLIALSVCRAAAAAPSASQAP